MCEIMERLNEKAIKETERNTKINMAKAMLANGKLSYEEIAQISGLTLDEVKAIAAGKLS